MVITLFDPGCVGAILQGAQRYIILWSLRTLGLPELQSDMLTNYITRQVNKNQMFGGLYRNQGWVYC